MAVVESAIKTQPAYSDPIGFSRQTGGFAITCLCLVTGDIFHGLPSKY